MIEEYMNIAIKYRIIKWRSLKKKVLVYFFALCDNILNLPLLLLVLNMKKMFISGLWCADRAALYSLVEIEKLKKKTAYDRHYLLLCVIFSVMARVRF
ncbi:hypothetical protein Anas_10430 [Armadillidium nasatum]|uniref:Uncharacterized protein n=1 Tax=Armadillidium nasatum TaxID=96803 RepID=A0A5N5SMX7_9CRUS|nr:hypothetical protein Anas_10430 [Armadillidium nasatum]